MQVDTRWAQPAVSNLASLPYDGENYKPNIEQNLSVHSPPLSSIQPPLLPTTSFFSPQRVEPIGMARSHQQNRNKTGYIQSATTDQQQTIPSYMQNQPIKRVQHPADRSSIVFFFQHISTLCLTILISLPCVIFITLLFPICWLTRAFLRLICRHRCTVTPCACSYLSVSDLFWFYNSNISTNRDKNDETTKLNSQSISPIAAAIFYLEGIINFHMIYCIKNKSFIFL
jgi:hypothetical protein